MHTCFRSIFAKIAALIWVIIGVDQVLRQTLIQTPNQVVDQYMAALTQINNIPQQQEVLTIEERTDYVKEKCSNAKSELLNVILKNQHQDNYFYLKSKAADVKNMLLCIPQRMASKSAFEIINESFDYPCYKGAKGKLRNCAVSKNFKPENETLKVVFTRHPLDRLIIEFRHQKSVETEAKQSGRKLLFSRHRNWKKSRKGSHQFREFINQTVLGPKSTILPVTQICSVCEQKYDIVYNLDEGLEHIKEIIEKAGSKIKNSTATDSKMKIVGPKIQRKFFSEVTADEIELLYNKFRDDFLLFGYSLDFYKNKG